MTDTETIAQLRWELDQERHSRALLRERLGRLIEALDRKRVFADMCFGQLPSTMGSATAQIGVFLAQGQVYAETILAAREVLG